MLLAIFLQSLLSNDIECSKQERYTTFPPRIVHRRIVEIAVSKTVMTVSATSKISRSVIIIPQFPISSISTQIIRIFYFILEKLNSFDRSTNCLLGCRTIFFVAFLTHLPFRANSTSQLRTYQIRNKQYMLNKNKIISSIYTE